MRSFFVFFGILLSILNGQAQDSLRVSRVAQLYDAWWFATDAEIFSHYAFVVTGNTGIRVVDLANPTEPVEVAVTLNDIEVADLALYDHYVYAATPDGIIVLDVVDPTAPQQIGLVEIFLGATYVNVVDNRLFAMDVFSYYMYDLSNPEQPSYLAEGTLSLDATVGVTAHGNTLFVLGSYSGLFMYDITTPADPEECGVFQIGEAGFWNAVAEDTMVYTTCTSAGFRILRRTAACQLSSLSQLSTVYVPSDLEVLGNYCYLSIVDMGLRVVDISDRSAPFYVATCLAGRELVGMSINGGLAVVTEYSRGIQVVNVENPVSPIEIGNYGREGLLYGAERVDSLLLIGDWEVGVRILSVANPVSPLEIGTYQSPGKTYWATAVDTLLLVAIGTGGLHIADLRNPAAPQPLATLDSPGSCFSLDVNMPYVYLACGGAGLRIVDLSDPNSPMLVGQYSTQDGSGISNVDVVDHVAYLPLDFGGLHIVDVADPANPTLLGVCDTMAMRPMWVAVQEGYAYVADDLHTLSVVDVQNPLQPVMIGRVNTPGTWSAYALRLNGNHAVVVGRNGLRVVSIDNPALPVTTGYFSYDYGSGHEFSDVALSEDGRYAYVPEYVHLTVFDCVNAYLDAPEPTALVIEFALHSAYPNPFNATTTMAFSLPEETVVKLAVFDLLGRLVATPVNGKMPAGHHSITFDAASLPSGVYIYSIEAGMHHDARKLVVLR